MAGFENLERLLESKAMREVMERSHGRPAVAQMVCAILVDQIPVGLSRVKAVEHVIRGMREREYTMQEIRDAMPAKGIKVKADPSLEARIARLERRVEPVRRARPDRGRIDRERQSLDRSGANERGRVP